jgi:hypothetical protein
MRLIGLVLLVLLGFIGSASAGSYTYNESTGYYYSADGSSFTRYWVSPSYYWSGCSWVQYQAGYWVYTPVTQTSTAIYPSDNYGTAVNKIFDVVKQRDKYELQNRKLAVEHSAILQVIDALGLKGNFTLQGYGQSVLYPSYAFAQSHDVNYANPVLNSAGINGTTQYGYTFDQLAQSYGTLDLNTIYQQAARNAQTAQQLGGDATSQFSGLVDKAGAGAARVAEILAQAEAKKKVLEAATRATQIPPSTTTQTTINGTGTTVVPVQPQQPVTNPPVQPLDDAGFVNQVLKPNCFACHGNGNKVGGVDLSNWTMLGADIKAKARQRVTSTDDAVRMPKAKDGSGNYVAGKALPVDQQLEFFRH